MLNKLPALWILLGWTTLNVVQALTTELIHDEAYYWVYAQNLDWGYFEQPPATAFFIYLGTWLFREELGVRLFFIVFSSLSLWLIWKITDAKDPVLFFALAFSILFVQLSFLAVPDGALLFFTCTFFLLLKHYLKKDSLGLAFLIGINVAALSYSKYHAIILLFIVFIANLKLVRRPGFWLIPLIATLLYMPHILWQIENGFPPIQFHLMDRMTEPHSFIFTGNFLISQLLLFGPLIGPLIFYSSFRYKVENELDRTMYFFASGILLFLVLLSLKGRVEANWSAMAVVPFIYLSYRYISKRPHLKRIAVLLAVPSLFIFLTIRIYLMSDIKPPKWIPRNEFQGWKKWATELAEVAKDRPVIFNNNYRLSSKYAFYSGKQAHSVNTFTNAGDHYDLLIKKEEDLQGMEVLHLSEWIKAIDTIFYSEKDPAAYRVIPDFVNCNRVKIEFPGRSFEMDPGETRYFKVKMVNPTDNLVEFYPQSEPGLNFHILEYRVPLLSGPALDSFPVKSIQAGESLDLELRLTAPLKQGEYRFRFSIRYGDFPGRNCTFRKLIVK